MEIDRVSPDCDCLRVFTVNYPASNAILSPSKVPETTRSVDSGNRTTPKIRLPENRTILITLKYSIMPILFEMKMKILAIC